MLCDKIVFRFILLVIRYGLLSIAAALLNRITRASISEVRIALLTNW